MKRLKFLLLSAPLLMAIGCSYEGTDSGSADSSNVSSINISKEEPKSSSKIEISSSNQSSASSSNSKSSIKHSHNLLPLWYSNDESHWKECAGCDEKFESGDHEFGSAIVVKDPTCSENGLIKYVCSVCNYEKKESQPSLEHNSDNVWHSDAISHWNNCLNSGCLEKLSTNDHSWISDPSNHGLDICSVCGRTKTSNHDHSYSEDNIVTKVDGSTIIYGYACECGDIKEVDYRKYSIKLGSAEGDLEEFNPYTTGSYGFAGELNFNPTAKAFEITISGDLSDKTLYVGVNDSNPSDLIIRTIGDSSTKLGGIVFTGANGLLTIDGVGLDVVGGSIVSGSPITISTKVVVASSGGQGTGITLTKGTLTIKESGSLEISGYDQAITLAGDETDTLSLDQVGDVKISNCNKGILGIVPTSSLDFKGNSFIVTDSYPVRANNNILTNVISGSHTWKSTTGATVLSTTNLKVGSETTSPVLNIISCGGNAISDQSNEASNTFDFISGTTSIVCEKANGDNSTIGFKVTGEDKIYVRKEATLSFDKFPTSIKGFTNITNLNIYGTLRVTNAMKSGIQEVTINVGTEDKSEEGTLYIEASGSSSSIGEINCIFINSYERINFYNGTALLVGNGKSNHQSGIYFDGCDLTKFRVNEGFKLGIANMQYGIFNHGNAFYGNYERMANLADYHYYDLEDCAWYCGDVKFGFTKHTTKESFKEVFGDLYDK